MSKLSDQLRRDEGFRACVYQDHLGYWTIGIGRLVDIRKGGGITEDEAKFLLQNDIDRREYELAQLIPWCKELDDARRGVLINMAFQLGTHGLMGFKNTLGLIKQGKYMAAANEMLKSKWAEQTPERAARLAKQMITGEWQ